MTKNIFQASDKEGNKRLDKDEMWNALQRMHINTTKKHALELFALNDVDKNGSLDYQEFLAIVKNLSRKEELVPVFQRYCSAYKAGDDDTPLMRIDELREFYRNEQKQFITIQIAMQMIKDSKDEGDQNSEKLSFFNFITIVYGHSCNSIFNYEHENVYQVRKF